METEGGATTRITTHVTCVLGLALLAIGLIGVLRYGAGASVLTGSGLDASHAFYYLILAAGSGLLCLAHAMWRSMMLTAFFGLSLAFYIAVYVLAV